jgi:hypothetical protein
MIPSFPNFRNIEIGDKKFIEQHCKNTDFYSDFIFSNAWTWDLTNKLQLSLLNNNLVYKFTDYDSGDTFYSFNNANKVELTIDTLLSHANQIGIADYLNYLPQEVIDKINNKHKYQIIEDRGGFDYIYCPESMKDYTGAKYKSKRQASNKFINTYKSIEVKEINRVTENIKFELRKIFQNHQRAKEGSEKSFYLNLEGQAFERTLDIKDELNVLLHLLIVDEELIGFSVDEIVAPDSVLSHFIKVSTEYQGAYEYFNQQLAKKLHSMGIVHWNWVEDLDIENLRRSKLSYRPSKILKQYIIKSI